MFKLQSIGKYQRPHGIEFAVQCPIKVPRDNESLFACFGHDIQIDRKKYKIEQFCVIRAAGPIKAGETIGILVKS